MSRRAVKSIGIGNDVVDLRDAESREGASHPRFDARVFTPAERAAIAASDEPKALRWAFWAAKEAAYKALKQCAPHTVWSPRRFEVVLEGPERGQVTHGTRQVALRLERGVEHVHAIACTGAAEIARSSGEVSRLPAGADAGVAARRALVRGVARRLGCGEARLRVAREGRIPLLRGIADGAEACSLSHHGRFVAWATGPLPPSEPAA